MMAVPGLDPAAIPVIRALERTEGPVAQVLHHVFGSDARRVEVRADFRRRPRVVVIVIDAPGSGVGVAGDLLEPININAVIADAGCY
jgi:hypothetical protein